MAFSSSVGYAGRDTSLWCMVEEVDVAMRYPSEADPQPSSLSLFWS